MTGPQPVAAELASLLEPLRRNPAASAVMTDVDGTLAPIVDRADQAAVPENARRTLEALVERYALVACVSGRPALEVRDLVGVAGVAYLGNHGYERLLPGADGPTYDPELEGHEGEAAEFAAHLDLADLAAVGLRVEDKGPIRALHWRGAADETVAEGAAREIGVAAVGHGLVPHWGRMVLEVRPAVSVSKGTAMTGLLAERDISHAFYGGDDRTDAEAFHQLHGLAASGQLESAVCVAVLSPEAPEELRQEADLAVDGPAGFLEVLRALVS